jgi:hypothetical protein
MIAIGYVGVADLIGGVAVGLEVTLKIAPGSGRRPHDSHCSTGRPESAVW